MCCQPQSLEPPAITKNILFRDSNFQTPECWWRSPGKVGNSNTTSQPLEKKPKLQSPTKLRWYFPPPAPKLEGWEGMEPNSSWQWEDKKQEIRWNSGKEFYFFFRFTIREIKHWNRLAKLWHLWFGDDQIVTGVTSSSWVCLDFSWENVASTLM